MRGGAVHREGSGTACYPPREELLAGPGGWHWVRPCSPGACAHGWGTGAREVTGAGSLPWGLAWCQPCLFPQWEQPSFGPGAPERQGVKKPRLSLSRQIPTWIRSSSSGAWNPVGRRQAGLLSTLALALGSRGCYCHLLAFCSNACLGTCATS